MSSDAASIDSILAEYLRDVDACEFTPSMSAHIAAKTRASLDRVVAEVLSVFTATDEEDEEIHTLTTRQEEDEKHVMTDGGRGSGHQQQHEAQQMHYNGRSSYNLLNGRDDAYGGHKHSSTSRPQGKKMLQPARRREKQGGDNNITSGYSTRDEGRGVRGDVTQQQRRGNGVASSSAEVYRENKDSYAKAKGRNQGSSAW
jgi:hypothetical protein